MEWDAQFGLVKVNPLANWTEKDLWDYIYRNDVPYNPLHDRGYPSLGCTYCTKAVAPGADPRSGRWQGFDKTECGIHVAPGLRLLTSGQECVSIDRGRSRFWILE